MGEAALAVPLSLGPARAIALGTVLRGACGLGDLKMTMPQACSGYGLAMR